MADLAANIRREARRRNLTRESPDWVRKLGEMLGPSVMEQERVRQEQIKPLLREGRFQEAIGIPSPFEGMGTADIASVGLLGAIRAFHGSPHKFDKFSTKNIGTGEGAQAYGHGLYFAESPGVAKSYQQQLRPLTEVTDMQVGGVPLYRKGRPVDYSPGRTPKAEDYARASLQEEMLVNEHAFRAAFDEGGEKAVRDMMSDIVNDHIKYAVDEAPDYLPFFNRIRRNLDRDIGTETKFKKGESHLYKVDIDADPEDFLDWDAPLSEQPPKIKDALARHWGEGIISDTGETGADFVNSLSAENQKTLGHLGIKGIRYKDAMSRSAEGGTSNYVVFDDELVKILSRE